MIELNSDFIKSDLTLEKFGYLPNSLSNFSNKKVIAKCEFCLEKFETTFKKIRHRYNGIRCFDCYRIASDYFKKGIIIDKHEFWLKSRSVLNPNWINFEETQKKFKHKHFDINKKVNKKVIAKCEFCFQNFETTLISLHADTRQICCFKCSYIAAKFNKQCEVINKHEFFEFIQKQKNLKLAKFPNLSKFYPNSDKKIELKCDFCLSLFLKPIKYLNFSRGDIVCKNCGGHVRLFYEQNVIKNKHEFFLSRKVKLDESKFNIQETVNKFGYDPRNLTVQSRKKVVIKCHICNSDTESEFYYFVKKNYKKPCIDCKQKFRIETIKQRYGVSTILEATSEKLKNPSTEQIIEFLLKDKYKVQFIRNYSIPITDSANYTFDFYVPSVNLLIECQGDYFHDFKKNGYSGSPKDQSKTSWVENNTNFKLIHIWEHEIHLGRANKILNYHISKIIESEINVKSLSDLTFKRIDDTVAHGFLSQYHYLGNLGAVSVCYGAFYFDNLICVCTFGGTTRQGTFKKINRILKSGYGPKDVRELRRFCIRPNVIVKKLASFCIRKFVDLYKNDFPAIKIMIGFSDPTVGDVGTIYKYSGWKQIEKTSKSYHYLDSKTFRMIHKKTVWNCASDAHMKENEFVLKTGLVKVGELSKHVWMKIFD